MFAGFILGFSNMGNFNLLVAGAFLLGLIGIIGLLVRSNRIETPIIDLKIFKNVRFSGHAISFFSYFNLFR